MTPGVQQIGSYAPVDMIAGGYPRVTETVTVASGRSLPAGAVVGAITASGKVVLSVAAATDGSEALYGVLVEAVDATAADAAGVIYLTGEFLGAALTFGAGHSATGAATKAALRALSIFIK